MPFDVNLLDATLLEGPNENRPINFLCFQNMRYRADLSSVINTAKTFHYEPFGQIPSITIIVTCLPVLLQKDDATTPQHFWNIE